MVAAPSLTGAAPSWLASRWLRLNGTGRLAGIDLARGLAVVGMFAAHMYALPEFDWTDASTFGAVADGRSSILFATLAGVSLALVSGQRQPLPRDELARVRARIVIRAGVIWVIGVLLMATGVPVFVILPVYAILFLVSLAFLRLSAVWLFVSAVALGAVMPFAQVYLDALPLWSTTAGQLVSLLVGWHYPFPVWIAFLLCGLAIGRLDLHSLRMQLILLTTGVFLAAVGYTLDAVPADSASDTTSGWPEVWTADAHSSGVLEVFASGGFAVAVIGGCLLLCRTPLVWAALPLRATGAMPLSAYAAQLVGWAIVATLFLGDPGDLVGFRSFDPFLPFTVLIIIGCTAWALLIGRGPLEWLVERVSRTIRASSATVSDR